MRRNSSARPAFPYWNLLWEMTRGEILMRDQGTVLGFLWTLLHPILMFIVLYGLFSKWMGKFVDQYVAYLLIGLVLWNFFQKATVYALGSLRRARGTILNYRFPREIAVFSSLGAVCWSSLLEIIVLMLALVLLGQAPHWTWLLLPGLLALELLLATAVGLFLAVWGAEYRDVERIWDVLTSALFYLTPVFYPLDILSPDKRAILHLNPMTHIIQAFRDCAVSGRAPKPASMLILLIGGLILAAAGLSLLRHREFEIADKLLV
ncbi:MAG: ABC transporter permease [Elusimicrobiota bacterium]